MSTVDDLLDFGSVGHTENSNSNDFGEISWQASTNSDLLGEFGMSTTKSESKSGFEAADEAQEGNSGSLLDESNRESDDPFGDFKMESSDSLLKDIGFDSDLLSGGTSSDPFGQNNPFESNLTDEPLVSGLDEPQVEAKEEEKEEEKKEEEEEEKQEANLDDESDEDGGPQVSSAIDDQVYYQDSSSEEEQNFDTIRPFKPTPAKRPSTSAITPETHEEEDETAAGNQALMEGDEEEEEPEEEEKVEEEEEEQEPEQEPEPEPEPEEEEEEEQGGVEATREEWTDLSTTRADESVNGAGQEEDANVDAFLSSRTRRFEEDDGLEVTGRGSGHLEEEEPADGSGFAYQEHVFQQDQLRDPSPELRESSRYVADTSATFDHAEGGSDEMCRSCGKRVYQMERLIADKHVYHKMCFKCSKCRSILSVGNFAVNNNELYCKPHFMELFKYRGRYDDNPDAPAPTNNGYSPPAPVARETRVVEEVPAGDVVRSDERVDDGIASGPGLSNLRSRFEAADQEQPQVTREAPPQRQQRQWKYQQQQQDQTREQELRQQAVETGRRCSEEVREEELPPQNMARNLAAKFRQMETTTDGGPPRMSPRSERKQREEIEQDREIVREGDANDIRPEVGTTRSLMSIWRNLESGEGRKEMSPPNQRPLAEVTHRQVIAQEHSERSPSLGSPTSERVDESQEELPPRDTTRSMAAIFRALETQGGPPPTPDSAMRLQAKAREQSGANATVRLPNTRQYSPQDEYEAEQSNGVYAENVPAELDPNVVRNDEPPPEEELPERGTTRNLVAMFKSMEAN